MTSEGGHSSFGPVQRQRRCGNGQRLCRNGGCGERGLTDPKGSRGSRKGVGHRLPRACTNGAGFGKSGHGS